MTQASGSAEAGGVGTGTLVGGGIGVLVVLAAGGVLMMRRRGSVQDRA